MWDAAEAILKASMQDKENTVLTSWVRGYQQAFSCFPRLHVIVEGSSLAKARRFLDGVPNVTYRANDLPVAVKEAGAYTFMQWHLLWADNFTSAPFVLFFDVDAVPVVPLRCHHLFDDEERLQLFAWKYDFPTDWTRPVSQTLQMAQARGETFRRPFTPAMTDLDFMTFWPIVAPRPVLPHARRLITQAYNETTFDAAWIKMGHGGCHADIISKVAATIYPQHVKVHLCPSIHNRTAHDILADLSIVPGHHATRANFSCLHRLNPVEHVKHPLQGLHSPLMGVRYMPLFKAAEYAHELINQVRACSL